MLQSRASNILAAAHREGVATLKLIGGLAIRRLFPAAAAHPALARVCKDIDFAVGKKDAKRLDRALRDNGFVPDRHFNALHGATRLLYTAGELQVDVFVDVFEQCHKLALEPRFPLLPETLPPADLLLMKLQVVQMNEKDLQDLCVLLLGAELGSEDTLEVINLDYIAATTSDDWGWYTTCMDSLDKLDLFVSDRLPEAEQNVLTLRVAEIRRRMQESPKSLRWKARNTIGRRLKWYELPEEARR